MTAALQTSRRRVMNGMVVFPVLIGRQRQRTQDTAGPVIRTPATKQGAVAAVVLKNKNTNQESRRGYGEQQHNPVADVERRPHQQPQRRKRHDGDGNFHHPTNIAGLPVVSQNPGQIAYIGEAGGSRCELSFVAQSKGLSWTEPHRGLGTLASRVTQRHRKSRHPVTDSGFHKSATRVAKWFVFRQSRSCRPRFYRCADHFACRT